MNAESHNIEKLNSHMQRVLIKFSKLMDLVKKNDDLRKQISEESKKMRKSNGSTDKSLQNSIDFDDDNSYLTADSEKLYLSPKSE
uniref:Uncharacterized protein n=1 Tax=Parastrongyloides trichosuri TaxID=131310 RepID=A0A0N4ZPD8_PARTI